MKKRIAEIETKFTSKGLAELRREIRDLGADAEAQDGFSNRIRDSVDHFKAARAEAQGLSKDLDEAGTHSRKVGDGVRDGNVHLKNARTETKGLVADFEKLKGTLGGLAAHFSKIATDIKKARTEATGLGSDLSKTAVSAEKLGHTFRDLPGNLNSAAPAMQSFGTAFRNAANDVKVVRTETRGLSTDVDRVKTSSSGISTHFKSVASELKKAHVESKGLNTELAKTAPILTRLGTAFSSIARHIAVLRTTVRNLAPQLSALAPSIAGLGTAFRTAATDVRHMQTQTAALRRDLNALNGAGAGIAGSLAPIAGHLRTARTEARGLRTELVKAGRTARLITGGFRTTANDIGAVRTAAAGLATTFDRIAQNLPHLTTQLNSFNQVLRRTAFHLRSSRIEANRLNVELGRVNRTSGNFSRNMRQAGFQLRTARGHARALRAELSGLPNVLGRVGGAAGKATGLLSRLGLDRGLFGAITRGAKSAAQGIIGAFTGAASSVAKLAFSPLGLIGGAVGAAGYGAYKFSPLVTGGAALAGASLAGVFTQMDLKAVKEFAEATGINTQSVQQWREFGNSVSLAGDDVSSAFQRLQAAQNQALDPTSDVAKIFKAIGVEGVDAAGNIRDVQTVMLELATASQKMNANQRNFALTALIGDPAKYNSFLKKMSTDRDKLLADYQQNLGDGLFASDKDIDRVLDFRAGLQDIFLIFRAITREIYIAFLPVFERFTANLEAFFRTPANRADFITRFFVKPFEKGLRLAKDISTVFFGFDLGKTLLNELSGGVENTWLFTLKSVVLDIWDVAVGLGKIFLGVGKAIVTAAEALDRFVKIETGVSVLDWIGGTGPQDVRAFFTDLGQIIGNVFSEALDGTTLTTSLGKWLSRQVESFKGQFLGFAASIHKSFDELRASWTSNQGMDGATTTLGKILILADETIRAFVGLAGAVKDVFFDGQSAPAGYEWLDQVKTTVDYIIEGFKEIWTVLHPIINAANELSKSTLGVNLLASTVIAKLTAEFGTAVVKAAPMALGAGALGLGAVIGGAGANQWSKWLFKQDPAKDAAQAKQTDQDFLDKGGLKTDDAKAKAALKSVIDADGKPAAANRNVPVPVVIQGNAPGALQSTSRNVDFANSTKAMDAEIARLDAADAAQQKAAAKAAKDGTEVSGPIGSINVTASGTGFNINLAGKSYPAIMAPDQADELQRSLNGAIGRR